MKKQIVGLLCAALLATGTIPYLEVTAAEPGHLIINQVYGNGDKTDAPVSHNFIEIYNPTEQVISLQGYSVEVSEDGTDGTEVELTGNIPAHTSYLIRGKESVDGTGKCTLSQADLDATSLVIDNKNFVVRLKNDGEIIDNVTVKEKSELAVSKQKSVRRINFQDTTEGDTCASADFAIIEYKDAEADFVVQYRPRSLADGAWPVNDDSTSTGSESVSGSDVSGGDTDNTPDTDENLPAEDAPDTGSEGLITLPATYGHALVLYSGYSVGATNEDGGVAEIVKYNRENGKMYVVSGQLHSVDIVDILADGSNRLYKRILVGELGEAYGFDAGDITSVDVNTTLDIIALAVQSSDYTASGHIVLLDYEGNYITKFRTGVQPDMVTFSPDGRYVMTADEGEPREGYAEGTTDPEGSVTLVTLNAENLAESEVKVCGFAAFDAERETLLADKVLLKKGTAPSVDLEPEYIAVAADSSKAYVSLQENNAIATLDLQTGCFVAVKGLGFKDNSLENNALDLNKDGKVNIQTEDVYSVYMPDGLATVNIAGVDYVITPNEGDAREWGDYTNIDSKKINGSEKKVEYLISEETDGLDTDKTYLLGGRSFSIFRADTMELVYDSGSDFEKITATVYPDYFNSNHKEAGIDGRSNKKGPEPEDVKTLAVGGKIYAFIGLERIGGIMMYDITNPQAPVFVDYLNHRDFTETDLSKAGDIGAEGICTIEAQYSPTGYPMVLVANEISGTVSIIGLTEGKYEQPSGDSTEGSENSGNNWVSSDEKYSKETDNGTVDWNIIAKKADAILLQSTLDADNRNINIKTGCRVTVPANILDHISGKNVTLAFHTGREITFSVSGEEIKKKQNNADLQLTLADNAGIPTELIKQLTEGTLDSKVFAMEEKTVYDTKVNVHFTFDKQYAGMYANLYRYDEAAGKMKYQGSYLITKTGQAMFAFPKGDEFVVTVTEKRP